MAAHSAQTIALCMIVRDEAAVIERCLRSALPVIDSWVVCDTGSTDATPELVRDTLSALPGVLHRRPWRDFGTNRTELMRLARGAGDYLLLIDADQTVSLQGVLGELSADAYLVRHSGDLDYAVPRVVRGDWPWRYEGVTHEYLASDAPFTQERLDEIVVVHHGDGGTRAEKLARDRDLLEAALAERPDDVRATFYLAQTQRDLGDHERAIELYRRRADLGGWDEEVFYATYQAGVLLARTDIAAGMALLREAWRLRTTRAEPLYELARLSRLLGRHEDAYSLAARGLQIPYPDDILFVHRPVYEWGLLFEYSVAAYWTGDLEASLEASEQLLGDRRLPRGIEPTVRENRTYCLARLESSPNQRRRSVAAAARYGEELAKLAPSTRLGEIRLDVSPPWPQFNPTIAEDGDRFRVIVRTANYRLEAGRYRFLDGSSSIATLNYLVTLDREFDVRDIRPLVDAATAPRRYSGPVEGYEDCRLARVGDEWIAVATVRDRNPHARCEVALLRLREAEISSVTVLRGSAEGRDEKNWMPFVDEDWLGFVYTCRPTVVLACDPATGELEEIAWHDAPPLAEPFRGGSQGVRVDDGLLFVVHEASHVGAQRAYVHRFVLLDEGFRLAAVSPPFRFAAAGIEFCAGLARRDGELILTFGVNDAAAGLAVVATGDALALLEPVARLHGAPSFRSVV